VSPDEEREGLGGCRRSSAHPACTTKHNFEATQEEEEEEEEEEEASWSGAVRRWGN